MTRDRLNLAQAALLRRRKALLDASGIVSGAGDARPSELSHAERHALARIHAALDRISHGTYGACSECARPIEDDVLANAPWQERCRACRVGSLDWEIILPTAA